LGILRQITPTQLAEIKRPLEAVGDQSFEASEKTRTTFETSDVPDDTMIGTFRCSLM
jgi:hypothetical protein